MNRNINTNISKAVSIFFTYIRTSIRPCLFLTNILAYELTITITVNTANKLTLSSAATSYRFNNQA